MPLKQIQDWLGHSDFSTTANIYAHLDYTSKLSSAQAMVAGMVLPEAGGFTSKWSDLLSEEDEQMVDEQTESVFGGELASCSACGKRKVQ